MSRAFSQGVAYALSAIVSGHGEDTAIREVLRLADLNTVSSLMAARVDPADMCHLEPVVRSMEGHGTEYADMPTLSAAQIARLREIAAHVDAGEDSAVTFYRGKSLPLMAAGVLWFDWENGEYGSLRVKPSPLGRRVLRAADGEVSS